MRPRIEFNRAGSPSEWDRVLSNFVPCRVVFGSDEYPTVEHAFQAQKATNLKDRELIASAPTPGRAKRIARTVKLVDSWDDRRVSVMVNCLYSKFTLNEELGKALLSTGDSELVEVADGWNDTYWGVGRSGNGKNMLGKCLMAVRSALIKKGAQSCPRD